jgi:hypothetical protein
MIDGWRATLLAGLGGALIGGGAMYWAGRQDVRAYLLENPEILRDAGERLQARETAARLAPHRAALERPFHSAWAGAADGDVVLVEFFDYACGFCRESNADIDRLLREDNRLKVVWREYPVLGPNSEQAAFASLAAARSGRFRDFYRRMFASGPPGADQIEAASAALRIDRRPLPADRAEMDSNYRLAQAIRAEGTPTFVVGDQILQGAVGYESLRKAIAAARRARRS